MELKIPPPLLALICAIVMWGISKMFRYASVESGVTGPLSLFVLIVGLAIGLSAIVSFRKAKTTVNAMKPQNTTRLVDAGIYKLSRNPMYLGVLLILTSGAIWSGNSINLAVLIFFVGYITKFQIVPEEKALAELFPENFVAYKSKVRRWI